MTQEGLDELRGMAQLRVMSPVLYETNNYVADGMTDIDNGEMPGGNAGFNWIRVRTLKQYDDYANPVKTESGDYTEERWRDDYKSITVQYIKDTSKWIFKPEKTINKRTDQCV